MPCSPQLFYKDFNLYINELHAGRKLPHAFCDFKLSRLKRFNCTVHLTNPSTGSGKCIAVAAQAKNAFTRSLFGEPQLFSACQTKHAFSKKKWAKLMFQIVSCYARAATNMISCCTVEISALELLWKICQWQKSVSSSYLPFNAFFPARLFPHRAP